MVKCIGSMNLLILGPLRFYCILPSGNLTVCDIESGPVEIVDLLIENGDFP